VSDYLLDTNILRYWYDDRCPEHTKVLAHVQAVRQPDPQTSYIPRLFISAVTVGEIEYGHRYVLNPDRAEQAEYVAFVRRQCPESLEIDSHVSEYYGELKAWLMSTFAPKAMRTKARRLGQLVHPTTVEPLGIEENDVWIAAQAITFGLVLVTNDTRGRFGELQRHFARTLRVENWAKP